MQSHVLVLEEKIKKLHDDPERLPEKIDLLNELAWEIGLVKPRRALAFAKESYRLSKKAPYSRGRAYSARNIAYCYLILSRLNRALQFANEALELSLASGDREGEAAALDAQAMIFGRLGNYQRALELAFRALQLTRETSFRPGEGWTLHNIGALYLEIEEYDQSIDYFQQAREIFTVISRPAGEARVLSGLGEVYYRMGDLKKSLQLHQKALEIMSAHDIPTGVNHSLMTLGKLHHELGQWAEARVYLEQSIALSQKIENPEMLAAAYLELGRLDQAADQPQQASERLTRALAYAEQSQAIPIVYRVHQALAELYEQLGKADQALFHYKRYHQLHQQVHEQENAVKMHNLQTRLDVEQAEKEAEIHRLRYVELAEMQARLIQSEKMAMLGKLSAGIAREVKTPLEKIISNSRVSREGLARAEEQFRELLAALPARKASSLRKLLDTLAEYARDNRETAQKISGIMQRLQRFAHPDEAERRKIDLHQQLDDLLELVRYLTGERIRVVKQYGKVTPFYAFGQELNRVFMTLLLNAVDAIEGEGEITIRTGSDPQQVHIQITDAGPGIPPEELPHIFETGFHPKDARRHLTAGLANSYNIIRKHQGEIRVESAPGQGTTFTIDLPRNLK